VDFEKAFGRCRPAVQAALVDPFLDLDMRAGLELEIALPGVLAVVLLQGALDIDRMRVVALDEIAVVAIHGPNEGGQSGDDSIGQASAKAGRPRRQIKREVGQVRTKPRILTHEQRLHHGHRFAAILGRLSGRFQVRFIVAHKPHNIMSLFGS
jgi:hypothetical protein